MNFLDTYQTQIEEYSKLLFNFLSQLNLLNILNGQVDHVALKAKDLVNYNSLVKQFLPNSISAQYVNLNNRKIFTSTLDFEIILPQIGRTNEIEVIEPRPEKVGQGFSGFEHIEIYLSDLSALQSKLNHHNIQHDYEDNGFHKAITVKLNSIGQEVKFTNTSLENVLKEEQKEGKLIKLK